MSGITTTQGYPYPLTPDFLDVQDAFRLATAVDTDLRGANAPFRSWLNTPSFIGRSTANSTAITNGSVSFTVGAIEWDNTGQLNTGVFGWSQPTSQGPSWWLFGANLILFESGTPTVNDMCIAQMNITTQDQVTGISTTTQYWQRNDDSNTNGEWLNVFAMAPIYRGNMTMEFDANGATAKGVSSGSRIWGIYLGPVT
jgi:hypothetical protein